MSFENSAWQHIFAATGSFDLASTRHGVKKLSHIVVLHSGGIGDFGRAYRIHGLFNCINDPAAFIGTTKRWIEEVDLREVSIVDEPSNDVKEL